MSDCLARRGFGQGAALLDELAVAMDFPMPHVFQVFSIGEITRILMQQDRVGLARWRVVPSGTLSFIVVPCMRSSRIKRQ